MDYSFCQTSEDVHEYIMSLKQCLLEKLEPMADESDVTVNRGAYD